MNFELSHVVGEGFFSTVYKVHCDAYQLPTHATAGVIAVKSVLAHVDRPPHNTLLEINLLSRLSDQHIVQLLDHTVQDEFHRLALPFYPFTLAQLLNATAFTPDQTLQFDLIAQTLVSQLCCAVAYLRSEQVAHRDINPKNILLSESGHLVLADFSTAIPANSKDRILDVSTGTYRAPELLFTHFDYDPLGLDLWSLGVTCAHFFTALVEESAADEDDEDVPRPLWMPATTQKRTLVRQTLFSQAHGEIGLAGSIFKVIGTPTQESWPETSEMRNFGFVTFAKVEKQDLAQFLPNLPHAVDVRTRFLTLLDGLLQASATARANFWVASAAPDWTVPSSEADLGPLLKPLLGTSQG